MCGHSSTIAVIKPSTVQNCESKPINRIIKKNRNDHNGEIGNCDMAFGYATNARPGPDAATSSIFFPDIFAIKPSTENITNPESKQVPSLNTANINVSL